MGAAPVESKSLPSPSRRRVWIGLLAILGVAALIRIRLLDIPLERDEGEYALAGQLMLHGIPPYQLAWNMKLPGTYTAYAAIMAVLGQSTRAIHLGLLAVNAATILLLYALARRWFGARGALAACGTFAMLSLCAGVLGMAGHATHFVVLFAVAATLVLFRAIESGSARGVFLSGLLYGTAVLMKQQGAFIGLFGLVWLLWTRARAQRLAAFAVGLVVPFCLTCIVLWKLGVFGTFWFWTFQYAREYASETTLADGWDYLSDNLPDVVIPNVALWLAAGAGLVLLWWRRDMRRIAPPLTLFLVFSSLAVCPGFYFRPHYFILMLPAVALLAGGAVESLQGDSSPLRGSAAMWLWAIALGFSLFTQRYFLFGMNPVQANPWEYELTPFPEAARVAGYIRAHSAPGSRIAVLGSEPEIYFDADRLPATGYMYTYGLMEAQPFALRMQDELIRQIEEVRPEYVVYVGFYSSWAYDEDSPQKFFDWWKSYALNYRRVGLVDVVGENDIRYRWNADAENSPPQSKRYMEVLRRR